MVHGIIRVFRVLLEGGGRWPLGGVVGPTPLDHTSNLIRQPTLIPPHIQNPNPTQVVPPLATYDFGSRLGLIAFSLGWDLILPRGRECVNSKLFYNSIKQQ